MIRFILNTTLIETDDPPGGLLLDYIRYHAHLTGTKIGCREGDCGACTVLIGELQGGHIHYRSATSCLTALGNIHQKHVVTIEGLNNESGEGLSFIQQALFDEGGSQCGFCTPGFIVSMAGFCLSDKAPTHAAAIAAVDGNICRCTGYKSIERALYSIAALLSTREAEDPLDFAITHNLLPDTFRDIPRRLAQLTHQPNGVLHPPNIQQFLGGGTDLYVQQPEAMVHSQLEFLAANPHLKGIAQEDGRCIIGGAATVTHLLESPLIRRIFPRFAHYARLISSTPIRNIATVGGNFVNASPIGDLSIFFLALDATLTLTDGTRRRELPLKKFFKAYKQLDKTPEEYIESISFPIPTKNHRFHFEKLSKRTCLDIASVNTALYLKLEANLIIEAHLSAGGVGPIPAYLEATAKQLINEPPTPATIRKAIDTARSEISPISDVRGSAEYKRLLLGQLIKAHFITLFPDLPVEELI